MINVKELNLKYVTDKNGHKKEIILPIEEFESLLEDLDDLAAAAERRDEKTIPHKELINELKNDGIL